MIRLTDEEILKAINDGRKSNKRDRRDGELLSVAPEYMQDKRYALKAQLKKVMECIEKNLHKYFVANSEGKIATTKEWQVLSEEVS